MPGRQIPAAEKKARAELKRFRGYVDQFVKAPVNLRKAETSLQTAEEQWRVIRTQVDQELEANSQATEDPEVQDQISAYEQEHEDEIQEFDLWVIDCKDKIQQAKTANQTEDVTTRNQATRATLVRQYDALKKQVENETRTGAVQYKSINFGPISCLPKLIWNFYPLSRFVLEHKIEELKQQIMPKDDMILDLRSQVNTTSYSCA